MFRQDDENLPGWVEGRKWATMSSFCAVCGDDERVLTVECVVKGVEGVEGVEGNGGGGGTWMRLGEGRGVVDMASGFDDVCLGPGWPHGRCHATRWLSRSLLHPPPSLVL